MQKVLVIGLGGSGGKTMSFLMEESLAQLKQLGWNEKNLETGKDRLPDCWKFIHIDIPNSPELAVAGAKVSSVKALGGEYIGVYSNGTNYFDIDKKVSERYQNSGLNGLQKFARWRPAPSLAATIAIAGGAGTYRAIGRALTLSAGERIYGDLHNYIEKLNNIKPEDGQKVADLHGSIFNQTDPPIVILVSSMAGGTGASMILDIADMLNGMAGDFPDMNLDKSSAFLYTADVFKDLPQIYEGAGTATLATISELIHSRTRIEDAWTIEEWRQLVGNSAPLPTRTKGRGPLLTIPVGGSVEGKKIGNKAEEIYRGFARVLSPILVDSSIQGKFWTLVNVNFPKVAQSLTPEAEKFKMMSILEGEGAGRDTTRPGFFGGFGSATLSTGRDRYKEYAAQRIARHAAHVLYEGYALKVTDEKLTTPQQKIDTMVNSVYAKFVSILNLDGSNGLDPEKSVPHIFTTYLGGGSLAFGKRLAEPLVSKIGSNKADQEVNAFKSFWINEKRNREQYIKTQAHDAVLSWAQNLFVNLESAVLMACSEGGTTVAAATLDKLTLALENFLAKVVVTAPREDELGKVLEQLSKLKDRIAGNQKTDLEAKLTAYFAQSGASQVRQAMVDTLNELKTKIFELFKQELARLGHSLQQELNAAAKDIAPAAYREAPLNAWPRDEAVPMHFEPAVNEILLTLTKQFPTDFARDIRLSAPETNDSIDEVAKQVISRKQNITRDGATVYANVPNWHTENKGEHHPHLSVVGLWRPAKLSAADANIPQIRLKLGPASLKNYALQWLEIPGIPFAESSKLSITSWLQQSPQNENLFASKLAEAVRFASPLVEIDKGMIKVLSGAQGGDIKYNFSSVPISSGNVAIATVLQPQLNAASSSNWKEFQDSCDPASAAQTVFISSELSPYSPWACKSLTTPIKLMAAKGTLQSSWDNMRARDLTNFVPLGTDRIAAFLRGWVIGRVTGRIKLEQIADGEAVVKVYQPADKHGHRATWLTFDNTYLGVSKLGASGASNWNIPAILLETLPMALAKINENDQSTWLPYSEVIELGLPIRTNQALLRWVNGATALDMWHNKSASQLGLVSQLSENKGTDLEACKAYLKSVSANQEAKYQKLVNMANIDSVTIEVEIAPIMIAAIRSVLDELNHPDLGKAYPEASTLFTEQSVEIVADESNEPIPDVEG